MEPSEAEGAGEAGTEACPSVENTIWMYDKQHFSECLLRSYEHPYYWYFLVWKPFDKTYNAHFDWYQFKGLEACRKMIKDYSVLLLTRETLATKTHVNALVCTKSPLEHGKSTHKYKLHVKKLDTLHDRQRVLDYISKEGSLREYKLYLDYIMVDKF